MPKRPRLYETMSREIREVAPMDGQTYRFYCCGPTVYGPAHIGNFRTFVVQDTFRRTLELAGQPTKHVRNVTDVDDKTIRNSISAQLPLKEFTSHWLARFHADAASLNLLPPHHETGAVDHIAHQIRLIEKLFAAGHAYSGSDHSVYFRVASFPNYGRLSHLDSRELRSGSTVEADEYNKDAVADFALWKARKPEDGANFWDSPWGEGRPGWHLECSAMAMEYLGDSFDMHSGGVDLIFPHHENEIAQSEAATGKPFCHHWMHVAHLMVDGGKMSKSLHNIFTLDQLAEAGFSGADLRYALLSGFYRQPLNFVATGGAGKHTFPSLEAAQAALLRLAKFETLLSAAASDHDTPAYSELVDDAPHTDLGPFVPAFDSLLDDLNTPAALGHLFCAVKEIKPAALHPDEATKFLRAFHVLLAALGLQLPAPETPTEAPPEIRDLAEKRWQAKQDKNWPLADQFRNQITAHGWHIKDTKDGYELSPAP